MTNSNEFKGIAIHSGDAMQQQDTPQSIARPTGSTAMEAEKARVIGEIQASLEIAMHRPRNFNTVFIRVKDECQRKSLAEKAEYAYKRGSKKVIGPTIHLAKMVAANYQNLVYGFRTVGETREYTEVETFCWDLENNTKAVRQFRVRHWRDTQSGGHVIKSQRDIREYVASQAQRYVRECIFQIVPEDLKEHAVATCRDTLKRSDPRSMKQKVESMAAKFQEVGVSIDMIENYLTHPLSAIVNPQMIQLGQVYQSIADGDAKREDFFDVGFQAPKADAKPKAKPKAKKRKSSKKPEPTQEVQSDSTDDGRRLVPPEQPSDNRAVTEEEMEGPPSGLTEEELAELEAAKKRAEDKRNGQGNLGV
jgi:hypothetical protein